MAKAKELLTVAELRKLRRPLRDINLEHRDSLTPLEETAVEITERVGSMGFFAIVFVWSIGWIFWNTLAPAALRFDPFPAFVLWILISNMIQIFLMPLIMIGQNLQARHFAVRAEVDLEVNMKAEREIEAVLLRLEHQHQLIAKLLDARKKTKKR